MDPRKKTVGTARACTANHRTVNTGYVVSLPKRAERNPFIFGAFNPVGRGISYGSLVYILLLSSRWPRWKCASEIRSKFKREIGSKPFHFGLQSSCDKMIATRVTNFVSTYIYYMIIYFINFLIIYFVGLH